MEPFCTLWEKDQVLAFLQFLALIDCTSYRGILLLSAPGKIFARVLLKHTEEHLPETQFGFWPDRGTCKANFSVRHLQEKS